MSPDGMGSTLGIWKGGNGAVGVCRCSAPPVDGDAAGPRAGPAGERRDPCRSAVGGSSMTTSTDGSGGVAAVGAAVGIGGGMSSEKND